jgi:hypothetical protein
MKTLLALAAAAVTTAVLSVPASATTVGCDQAEPYTTVKAIDCRLWDNNGPMAAIVAPDYGAVAAAPHTRIRQQNLPNVRDDMSAYPPDKN